MPNISFVVPVFNSEHSLTELTLRIQTIATRHVESFELILVNDGSCDESWRQIEFLASKYPFVCGIKLLRNFGQHNALLAGIRMARFEFVITLDDDLQHPPESVPELLKNLGDNDVIYGFPESEKHTFLRSLASKATKLALQEALGASTAKHVSAFRLFRTHLREAFSNYHSPSVCLDVLLTWGSDRFTAVSVPHHERKHGTSSYTLVKLIRHAANMMTGFTVIPLQLSSWIGFGFTFFGIAILTFVISRWLIFGSVVPGFAFLASEIAIFSGIQLFSLGIIGEYLARMHQRSLEKPTYVIAKTTFQSQNAAAA